LLHGPQNAAIAVLPPIASAVVTLPGSAQVLTGFHSEPDWMAKPLSCHQTVLPPASQWLTFDSLATNGAMNRALMSGGAMLRVFAFVSG
jgi:hypothetical protein